VNRRTPYFEQRLKPHTTLIEGWIIVEPSVRQASVAAATDLIFVQ